MVRPRLLTLHLLRRSVGDVCISPVSVNWVCKKSTWTLQSQGFPNQCFRPREVAGPNATSLYGECLFATDNVGTGVRAHERGSRPRKTE